MMSSKKKAGEQLIVVDAGKLSRGLKATFEGVAMVFDSLGVDAGFDVTEKEEDKAGKKSAGKAKEDKVAEPVQEMKDEVAESTAKTAGGAVDDVVADGIGKAGPDAVMETVTEESDEATEAESENPEIPKNPENPKNPMPAISQDDVTKIIVQKIKQNRSNNQKIGQILKTYGVVKVGELDPKKYEAFVTDLAAL